MCDAIVIVLHFLDEDWGISACSSTNKSITGEELARQLILCLSTELGITTGEDDCHYERQSIYQQ